VSRASEEYLAQLHGLVAMQIMEMMQSENPRDVKEGVALGLKFLKDNNITATVEASAPMADIKSMLPSADELEKLMSMTPD
jgi:hypothetical protein